MIKKVKKAFTLAEILISCAILSLFMASVFSFYRMGGQMFTSGNWRQITQKEAELFCADFRNKASRASAPVTVKTNGTYEVSEGYVGWASDTVTVKSKLPKLLCCFPVCVSSIKGKKGVITYNMLRAVASQNNKNVFDLEFLVTNNKDKSPGIDFLSGSSFSFFKKTPSNIASLYNGKPGDYNLGSMGKINRIKDLSNASVKVLDNSDGNFLELTLNFQNPKNDKAKFNIKISAPIDKSMDLDDTL